MLHTIRRRQKENLPRNLTKQSNGEARDCWPAAASRTRGRAFLIWARSRRREGHTAPFFLLSSRIAAAAGPASPHGHCWAVRGRRPRSSPFSPPALAVCLVYCLHTVCRMGHWVGPPFTVDTHANAIQARPRPPKKPKPKESLALVHRSYNRERERE
jgi:hypothetical protein